MHLHPKTTSEDSPCHDCQHNCCDPLVIGHPKKFAFPLPKGGCPPELFSQAVETTKKLIRDFVEKTLLYPDDNRFSVQGIILWPSETHNSETEIIRFQNMMFVALHLRVVLNCSAFDHESGSCTKYDTRPDICKNFQVEKCGLSKVAVPKLKADGTQFTIDEIVAENKNLLILAKATAEEAIASMIEEIRSYRI